MICWLAALIAFSLLFSVPASCSDNDERPAYMIYIDPETGKYTTQNPEHAANVDVTVKTEANGSKVSGIIAGTLLLMVVSGYALQASGRWSQVSTK